MIAVQSRLDDPRSVTDLLLRAREGDSEAWKEVVRRYGKLVSETVRSFQLQEADALDAMQMTWLRLVENAHRVLSSERLAGWLTTIARRECLHILRQAKRTPDPIDTVTKTVADPSAGPELRLVDAEAARTLWNLVEELPPRQRTLLRALFADSPRPYAEVARNVGIPTGSIGPTRARALRQLRCMLAESVVDPWAGPEQRTPLRALFTADPRAYFEAARAAGIPTPSIGPTRARAIAQLRHRRSKNPSGYPEPGVEGVPAESDRTGSYLLDDLLDKAEQALREKLEPKPRDLETGSSQGTGDAQLDDLLQRADAALRERQ